MNKKLLIILIIALAAAGGWFGYNKWAEGQSRASRMAISAPSTPQPQQNAAPQSADIQQPAVGDEVFTQLPTDVENGFTENVEFVTAQEPLQNPAQTAITKEEPKASNDEPVLVKDLLENKTKIAFSVPFMEDPTISQSDRYIVEQNRLAKLRAEEAARKAKLEAERQARLKWEAEQRRLAALRKDPAKEVREKIRLQGIINQEVFIDGKVYTVGSLVYGARITYVSDNEVGFSFKNQTFKKTIDIN
ncbi:hypothetical protein Dip510_001272 [Elusimicrobium posterum]|uniref:hypothetical protein n=1 Tax=Elusimicrobium posterum TaxID=3116653 RepID=UPI003C75B74B